MPGILDAAEAAFGMRHHDRETTISRGQTGNAQRRTVWIGREGFGKLAIIVDITHGDRRIGRIQARKLGTAFAMRDDHRQHRTGHATEENRR